MRQYAFRKNTHKHIKKNENARLEVIVITHCLKCGKEGGVQYAMNTKHDKNEKQLWPICTDCVDFSDSKKMGRSKFKKKGVIVEDKENSNAKEHGNENGFLFPRLLD